MYHALRERRIMAILSGPDFGKARPDEPLWCIRGRALPTTRACANMPTTQRPSLHRGLHFCDLRGFGPKSKVPTPQKDILSLPGSGTVNMLPHHLLALAGRVCIGYASGLRPGTDQVTLSVELDEGVSAHEHEGVPAHAHISFEHSLCSLCTISFEHVIIISSKHVDTISWHSLVCLFKRV